MYFFPCGHFTVQSVSDVRSVHLDYLLVKFLFFRSGYFSLFTRPSLHLTTSSALSFRFYYVLPVYYILCSVIVCPVEFQLCFLLGLECLRVQRFPSFVVFFINWTAGRFSDRNTIAFNLTDN